MGTKLNNKKSALKNAEKEKDFSLHYYFDVYEKAFSKVLSHAGSEFLAADVDIKLTGISQSSDNVFIGNDYFVTQASLSKNQKITIKISDSAANVIFRNSLGDRPKEKGYLKLKDITEFEAILLTAFNEFLYKKISRNFLSPVEIKSIEQELDIKDEKTIYLTFFITGNTEDESGKIVIAFPEFIVGEIKPIMNVESPLNIDYFNPCPVEIDIIAGYSRITLEDVKNLDCEDIVILEKSSLYSMILKNNNNFKINITPDPNIVINLDEENGDATVNKSTENIWDSLEVDLSAEFEKVKIRLGDLRQIMEGLVIDVAPIAQNKIFLNVEGKQIASGELVIIDDKYGIKITEVYKDAKPVEPVAMANNLVNEESRYNQDHETDDSDGEVADDASAEIDDSDFDFSDYEIEEDV